MIAAVVLAAGASHRMGSPKALLKIGEKTFLQHIVDELRSVQVLDIVIVLGSNADEIQTSLEWFDGKVVVNEDWQQGQLSSIIKGIDALDQEDLHGAILFPVDHPLISRHLIANLLHSFWISHKNIVVPVYRGRRGHPVIVSTKLFDDLRNASLDVGARQLIRQHPDDLFEMNTDEEGVILNIDTPEDYEKVVLPKFKD